MFDTIFYPRADDLEEPIQRFWWRGWDRAAVHTQTSLIVIDLQQLRDWDLAPLAPEPAARCDQRYRAARFVALPRVEYSGVAIARMDGVVPHHLVERIGRQYGRK